MDSAVGHGYLDERDFLVSSASDRLRTIEVDTQSGEFTKFKVILPHMAATGKAGADK